MYWHLLEYVCLLLRCQPSSATTEKLFLSYELHVGRGDGSNAYTLRSSKVFASEIISHFCIPAIPADLTEGAGLELSDDEKTVEICETKVTYPDLGIIPEHCTAVESRRLWQERFDLLGIHHWSAHASAIETVNDPAQRESLGLDANGPEVFQLPTITRIADAFRLAKEVGFNVQHVAVFVLGTDAGPDQAGCRNNLFVVLAPVHSVVLFWFFCLAHQSHLIVGRGLRRTQHQPSLAKRTNLWRGNGSPAKIYRAFRIEYGDARAKEVCSKLPPRPLKSRWGYTHSNEYFWIAKVTREQTRVVYRKVFALERQPHQKRRRSDDEETAAFQEEQPRWISEALVDNDDDDLWASTANGHIARGPVIHFTNWAMKEKKSMPKVMAGGGKQSIVQQLALGKARWFCDEFKNLIFDPTIYDATLDPMGWGLSRSYYDCVLEGEKLDEVQQQAVLLTLEAACDFTMRIVNTSHDFPPRLALAVAKAPNLPCINRIAVFRDMLALLSDEANSKSVLYSGVFKLATLFRPLLQAAVDHGGRMHGDAGAALYDLLVRTVQEFVDSTQEIEGYNNVIKKVKETANNISYALLNTRSINKKSYALEGGRVGGVKCHDVVTMCLAHHTAATESLTAPDRLAILQGPYLRDLPDPEEQSGFRIKGHPTNIDACEHAPEYAVPIEGPPAPPPPRPHSASRRPAAPAAQDDDDQDALAFNNWLKTKKCAVECAMSLVRKVEVTAKIGFEFDLRRRGTAQPVATSATLFPFKYGRRQLWMVPCQVVRGAAPDHQDDFAINNLLECTRLFRFLCFVLCSPNAGGTG